MWRIRLHGIGKHLHTGILAISLAALSFSQDAPAVNEVETVPAEIEHQAQAIPVPLSPNSPDSTVRGDQAQLWLIYLSSLAVTITAGSTLLVAIAVIRMQAFASLLGSIEKAMAEAFLRVDKLDIYTEKTSAMSLAERWNEYFDEIDALVKAVGHLFSETGRYTETRAYVVALMAQGRRLDFRNRRLRKAMMPTFVATAFLAGAAILSLPAADWITASVMRVTWITSGAVSFLLLAFFLHTIYSAFQQR